MAATTVDDYINGLGTEQREIVARIRKLVLRAAPGARESIKWAQPVYESDGPFSYIKAFKNAVNFGFWRGVEIRDPKRLLRGSGDKMRHVRLGRVEDVDERALEDFVHQAVRLNRDKGDPTKGS